MRYELELYDGSHWSRNWDFLLAFMPRDCYHIMPCLFKLAILHGYGAMRWIIYVR